METLLTAPDIEYLRGQQMKLDEDIIRKNGIRHDEWMEEYHLKHQLALKVEVHEFINECREWKYWRKKPADRDRIIDEAVDVLHFVALHWNKGSMSNEGLSIEIHDVIESLNAGFYKGNTLVKMSSLTVLDNETTILGYVLSILNDYNFTTQDIIDAYNRKNAINFERLESGY